MSARKVALTVDMVAKELRVPPARGAAVSRYLLRYTDEQIQELLDRALDEADDQSARAYASELTTRFDDREPEVRRGRGAVSFRRAARRHALPLVQEQREPHRGDRDAGHAHAAVDLVLGRVPRHDADETSGERRTVLMVRPDRDLIGSEHPVEVDETLVGGRTRGQGRGVHHKVYVMGAVEVRTRQPGEDKSAAGRDTHKDGKPLRRQV